MARHAAGGRDSSGAGLCRAESATLADLIYFQHKPDAVFTAILRAALERELAKVTALNARHDLAAWDACYPHSSRRFSAPSALLSFEQLLEINRSSAVYRISDSHWLLLYECLENFCAELNDVAPNQPDGLLPVGDCRLAEIDFDAVVALYFWDTEFLVPLDESKPTPDLAGHAHGWRADSDESRTEKVDHPAWRERSASDLGGPNSRRYPDWDEGAEF